MKRLFSEEEIAEFIDSLDFSKLNKEADCLELNDNAYLCFNPSNAIHNFFIMYYYKNEWRIVSKVKIGLTGDFEDDFIYGVEKVMSDAKILEEY